MDDFPAYCASIHHDGSTRYVRSPHPNPQLGDTLTLRLRAALEAPIERILLRTNPDGEQQFDEMSPEEVASQPSTPCRWWQVQLRLSMPHTGYRFLLFTSDGAFWYNSAGLHRYTPTDANDFRLLAGYAAPTWVHDSVFYQIFPDRFADGDPANNVRDGEFEYRGLRSRARRWGEAPDHSGLGGLVEFFGGDLQGIEQHLDYLQDLGVNALYLNPIFTAFSNHRYDVTDYFQVDPHIGGEAALVALRTATTHRAMRFILDIVPNHCGVLHPWFQEACADPGALSAEYFTFYRHPEEYASWLGVRSLPKFNYRSANLRQVMYEAPDAVFRYWMQPPFSIDGWRLDVANMLARQGADQLGAEVGQGIRQAVKSENPQAYLLGENFFDASSQLQGDMWDASMNYAGFSKPLLYWLSHFSVNAHGQPTPFSSPLPWSTQALVDSWQIYRAAIPWTIASQQFNLLGSHDTPRIWAVTGENEARTRLAAGLLLTYVGIPSIYYGDEIGLGDDARACMVWDPSAWDTDLYAFYRDLVHLRRSSPALIEGGFQVLLVEENTLAYLRDTDQEQIIVIAQRGPGDRPAIPLPVAKGAIPDGMEFVEIFSGWRVRVENGHLPLGILPPGIEIWRTYDMDG